MSPIKDLTDRARLPRLGKIRLGIKKKSKGGVEHPQATDYFVLPDEPAMLKELYGEQPKELPIILPVEDEDIWASQWYRAYSMTRGLICKGDGETCTRTVDKNTGDLATRDTEPDAVQVIQMDCAGKECPDYQGKRCAEIMMLQFMLPDVPGLGVWQIDTSSINSIMNINGAAQAIHSIYGRVSMIPLILTLEPQQVLGSDKKTKTVHCLNIRVRQTLREMLAQAQQTAPQLVGAVAPELPVPDDEVPDVEVEPELDFTAESGEQKPLRCKDCPTWKECQGSNLEDCERSEKDQAEELDFDPEELKIQLKEVKWKHPTVISYCMNIFKVDKNGEALNKELEVVPFIASLKREDREAFFKEIEEQKARVNK